MKKNIFLAALVLLFATSCSKESENEVKSNDTLVPVTIHIDGFTTILEGFDVTRTATPISNNSNLNAVMLAFYNGSTEVSKTVQLLADATTYTTFGTFNLNLPMGNYTMVAIAYNNFETGSFGLTSPTAASYAGDHAFDTFVKTQTVNITTTNPVDVSATLNRVVSRLKVVSTDGKTADVANVRMTLSAGGRSFNPTTGLATVNTGFSNTVSNSANTGSTTTSLTYFFLATDEQTMNVTIETLNANGDVLRSTTVNNVPFKRNRTTVLTGPMYNDVHAAGTFLIDADWVADENIAF